MGVWEPGGSGTAALTIGPAVALLEEPTSLAWLDASYLVPALAVGLLTRYPKRYSASCLASDRQCGMPLSVQGSTLVQDTACVRHPGVNLGRATEDVYGQGALCLHVGQAEGEWDTHRFICFCMSGFDNSSIHHMIDNLKFSCKH